MDRKMMKALEADGEKLRQLTGEGHGPQFPLHGFYIFLDGDAWCAVGPHFIDIMQSDCGFGGTPEEAVSALHEVMLMDSWWQNKPLPTFEEFTVHG